MMPALTNPKGAFVRYGAAIAAVAVALGLKFLVDPLIEQETPFLLFFTAVTVSAWFGGLGPGLVAALLSMLLGAYYFMEPVGSFVLKQPGQYLRLGLFMSEVVLVSIVCELLRAARRRAENSTEALRESDELFRLMVEDVRDYAIVMIDPDGRVASWNAGAERIKGYRAKEIIGKHYSCFFLPEDRASGKPEENLRRAAAEGRYEDESPRVRKDGSTFLADAVITALYDAGGRLRGFSNVTRDVTEQRRAEEARARAKEELEEKIVERTTQLQEANDRLSDWVGELELRTNQITLLGEMGDMLEACVNLDEARRIVATYGARLFPDADGAVCLINPSRNLVEESASWGGESVHLFFQPGDCWALRRGRLYCVEEANGSVRCAHAAKTLDPVLCVPMMAQGEAFGVLHLRGHAAHEPYFSEPRRRLAAAAAEQLALAISNLRLRETLRNQAIRDQLTGLFNRRYLEEALDLELRRAARREAPLGVVVFDIDHFKRFNDTFGHAAGDAVLRELGALLGHFIRGGDIACRYGGEEFVLVMPDSALEDTTRRAEQLREEASRLSVELGGQRLGDVTLSLGISAFPNHGATADALVRAADAALYNAKSGGRNRVVVA